MEQKTKATIRLVSPATLVRWMKRSRIRTATELADATYDAWRRGEIDRPIKRQIVSHLLNGRRETVSLETACAIEAALNVDPGTIFQDTPIPVFRTTNTGSRVA